MSQRRRRIRVSALAAVVAVAALVTGISVLSLQSSADQGRVSRLVVLTPLSSLACPAAIANFQSNRTHSGINTMLIPVGARIAHACQHGGGAAGYESEFTGSDVSAFATTLNLMTATRACALVAGASSTVALVRFGYDHDSEVDVVITTDGKCTSATNGVLTHTSTDKIVIPLLGPAQMSAHVQVAGTTAAGRSSTPPR